MRSSFEHWPFRLYRTKRSACVPIKISISKSNFSWYLSHPKMFTGLINLTQFPGLIDATNLKPLPARLNVCILQTVLWVIKSRKRDKIWLRETLPADFALKLNLRRGFNGTVKRYRPPSCYVSCFHSFSRYLLVYSRGPRRDWLVPKPVPSPQPVYRRFPIGLGPLWFKTGFVRRVYALLRCCACGWGGSTAVRPAETDRKAEPMRFSRFRRCLWFG